MPSLRNARRTLLTLVVAFQLTATPGLAGDARPEKVLKEIGPWVIKLHHDDDVAHVIGQPCSAIQYANGAELEIMADPDDPSNAKTIKLFIGAVGRPDYVQLTVDDGMRFESTLEVIEPQRGGVSGVVPVADLVGRQIFVTPGRGMRVLGRYAFPLAGLRQAAAFVHQKRCIFDDADSAITALQFARVKIGQSMSEVTSLLGEPRDSGQTIDDRTVVSEEWFYKDKERRKRYVIEFGPDKTVSRMSVLPR